MGRRIARNRKPTVEMVEHRELLSLVTDIMAGNYNAMVNSPKVRALLDGVSNPGTTQAASASGQVTTSATVTSKGRLTPTSQSIALPKNQGFLPPASPGYNLLLQPTGTATSAEVKRQLFKAVYRGPYIITPGAFSSQAMLVNIRAREPTPRCCTATSRCGWPWPPIPRSRPPGPPRSSTGTSIPTRFLGSTWPPRAPMSTAAAGRI